MGGAEADTVCPLACVLEFAARVLQLFFRLPHFSLAAFYCWICFAICNAFARAGHCIIGMLSLKVCYRSAGGTLRSNYNVTNEILSNELFVKSEMLFNNSSSVVITKILMTDTQCFNWNISIYLSN